MRRALGVAALGALFLASCADRIGATVGAGAVPANASARKRCPCPSTLTAADFGEEAHQSESGSITPSISPGSPFATSSDETVRPALPTPVPLVHTVTGEGMRPRMRRSGSRSSFGGMNGWSEWIVTHSAYGLELLT